MSTSVASSSSSSSWRDAFASCTLISESMQGELGCDGLLILHRSKWRCLASSYSAEIRALIQLVERISSHQESLCHELAGPLKALEKAVQEGEACMQDYIMPRGNYNSWLVDKALKYTMSTDVVDVHLHHFLWLSSTVRDQIFRIAELQGMELDLLQQVRELHEIWAKVDADDDLRAAQSLLINLTGHAEYGETCQLVDFILHKLSHVEAPHDHVAPGSLPPNYMCIDSDQCLPTNTECLLKTEFIEIRPVVWLGGHFVLKRFQGMETDQLFNREAAIQARVCHSHVVPLVCCTNMPPGLLMELMQGDLHALITDRRKGNDVQDPPFSLLTAVDLMLQIAKGMEYLHSNTLRIIHRDLKSHNILVSFPMNLRASSASPQVHLKIADFGVSKAKHDCSVFTTRDQGTPFWMAPEVYDGGEGGKTSALKYSNKADVYSFGMVCFEILTGKYPFEGPNLRKRVLKGERPTLPPHCPPALSSFIEMCWHADPNERPTFMQICRMLRYFKACLLLKDCHNEVDRWLSEPLVSPHICDHIDKRIEHSLEGLILEPKALSIPLEMYWCGVELHKFAFVSRPERHGSEGWDAWNAPVYALNARCWQSGVTREQEMCKARWFRPKGKSAELAPVLGQHLSTRLVRCFTFEELRRVTGDFYNLLVNRGEWDLYNCMSREQLLSREGQENRVHRGRLTNGQEVAVRSQITRVDQSMVINSGPLLGWCREQDTLFLVFPCPARILGLDTPYCTPLFHFLLSSWLPVARILGSSA